MNISRNKRKISLAGTQNEPKKEAQEKPVEVIERIYECACVLSVGRTNGKNCFLRKQYQGTLWRMDLSLVRQC